MKKKCNMKLLSSLLCMMLFMAMTLCTTGCGGSNDDATASTESVAVSTESVVETTESVAETVESVVETTESVVETTETVTETTDGDSNVLGEGQTKFTFTVVDKDGNETDFEIHTDKETVGEALLELNLIEGEDSEYGLYVKTVNGITADYDTDGVYWAFYVNGEYATSGVDTTPVTEGDSYSFKVEK